MTDFAGTAGNDVLTGTDQGDRFDLTQGGDDTASGGAGFDVFDLGGTFTAQDRIDGGSGDNDTLRLDGDYAAGLVLQPTTISHIETINLADKHSYRLELADQNVDSASTLLVSGVDMTAPNTVQIDGSQVTGGGKLTLYGGAGNDTLIGGSGADTLGGGAGTNTLSSGGGDDQIRDTGTGSTIDGGPGHDSVQVERVQGESLTLAWNGTGGTISDGTTISNVEHLSVITGAGNDTLTVTPPPSDSWLAWDGGAGSDTVAFDWSSSSTPYYMQMFTIGLDSSVSQPLLVFNNVETFRLTGGSGGDTMYGGTGNDILIGNGGDDNLYGHEGTNTLLGGAGDDNFQDGGSGSTIDGGSGFDFLALDRSTWTAPLSLDYTVGAPSAITLSDGTTIANVESLNIHSGSGDDTVTVHIPDGTDDYLHTSSTPSWDAGGGNDTLVVDLSTDTRGVATVFFGGTPTFGVDHYYASGPGQLPNYQGLMYSTDHVENYVITSGSGNDKLLTGDGKDTLTGGSGNDSLDGGGNVDTAVFSGNRAAYTITQTATGVFTVGGPDGTDALTNIEFAKFGDQTMRLLPGSGTTVSWSADPSTYMAAIRDFDGNDLGGASSWKLIGTADVNGDGSAEHILFNRTIGRWAEVGTEADGKTYFANSGWAGDTRVVGLYIDPLVANGTVVKGSDTDSQRRFQNDLQIDNIKSILGQGDYNHDGLQEIYFSLTDGTAYLHAYMHADGNIQYANYQNQQQVIDYLTTNGVASSTWSSWFAGT